MRARYKEATPETYNTKEEILNRCELYQRTNRAPNRFYISLGAENLRFNERVFLNIMYFCKSPILLRVDVAKRFNATTFFSSVSADCAWVAILNYCACIYTILPNRIFSDQGSQFGPFFNHLVSSLHVKVERTFTEDHSSLGLLEKYHDPLSSMLRKIMITCPDSGQKLSLACADKSMNDTMGPESLVGTDLVSGEYPNLPARSDPFISRRAVGERSQLAEIARREISVQMAKLKLKGAVHNSVTLACDPTHKPVHKVIVWREKQVNNKIGEWQGSFTVTAFDADFNRVYVQDTTDKSLSPFNLVHVKPYYELQSLS